MIEVIFTGPAVTYGMSSDAAVYVHSFFPWVISMGLTFGRKPTFFFLSVSENYIPPFP